MARATMRLWGVAVRRLWMKHVLGDGGDHELHVNRYGDAAFALPRAWAFAMYAYEVG